METAISVIVPIYRVEKFLPQCIESVLNQTFTDFELILVDDGSPDRCPAICDEAAERDARVRVIHQANAGLSAARNAGIEIAHGEWLGFVDSDDYIAPQFYEKDYYTPSDDGFLVFDTPPGCIGVVVCFDRHYPESIRTEALMGAALILIPTANTMAEPLELFDWEIRVQAFQSSVAVAMCNRTGLEGGMDFAGGSIVTEADGDVIAKAGPGEELLFAEVDMAAPARIRAARPYTSLRRTALYR